MRVYEFEGIALDADDPERFFVNGETLDEATAYLTARQVRNVRLIREFSGKEAAQFRYLRNADF